MNFLTILGAVAVIYSSWLQNTSANEVCCDDVGGCYSDAPPYEHLPVPDCFAAIFSLFTSNSSGSITAENVPDAYNPARRTIFIVHGYRGDVEGSTWMGDMKDQFLIHGEYNVILVDWGAGSKALWYPQSAANIRVAAFQTAALVSALITTGAEAENMYCIGHSLGGHTCGHVGKLVHIGRITGLDPAGPMFESYPSPARLESTDADIVDVIHTNGDDGIIVDYGTMLVLGHVDFYPNGGGDQPGCITRRVSGKFQMKGEGLGCSHSRAVDYFIESINTACFTARQTCTDPLDLPGSCIECTDESCPQSMGFYSEHLSNNGIFYLATNGETPFCMG